MDEIEEVVREIVNGCASHKVHVSELLAAFVARTVLEGDAVEFALDKDLTDADVNAVINMSVMKLLEKDSPTMETIKMQVRRRHKREDTHTWLIRSDEKLSRATKSALLFTHV